MTRKMTEGHPAKLIFFFTIPLLIGNFFQQLYSMADTLIVGRTINVDALAAVGCTGSLSFFILGFAQGMTAGLAIPTAQRFGAGDMEGVRKSFASSILISACVTVVLTAVSVPLAGPLLRLMRTPDGIFDDARQYITIIFWGIGTSMLFNLLSNIIRALGDSRTPLIFLAFACVLNIGLDYLLILRFSMGVSGAAVATVISQLVSGLLCIVYLLKKLPALHLKRSDWRLSGADIGGQLRVGLPMGFQSSIISLGAIILQAALNQLGAAAVAAYTAAQKIDTFATMPMMSFGITMATYAAQNYGAGRIDRIRSGLRQCCAMSVGFSVAVGVLLITTGRFLIRVFVGAGQEHIVSLAQTYLVVNGSMYFLLALLFIFRYTLQGLGRSFVPTFAGVMELGMRTFAALVLSGLWGFTGACMANPLAWLGSCVPLIIAYFFTMRRLTEESRCALPDEAEALLAES